MIFDSISNVDTYDFNKDMLQMLDSVSKVTSADFKVGCVELENGDYMNFTEYKTHIFDNPTLEVHNKYIDVMYIVEGSEIIYVSNKEKFSEIISLYSEENEYMLAKCKADNVSLIKLKEGDFVIFYPQDAHCCGRAIEGISVTVKKIVGKLRIKQ